MRPDPGEPLRRSDGNRIIHIGEVRRRRASRRRVANRYYLASLALLALLAWASWLIVLLNLQPERLLTYIAFFAPLSVALASTSAIVIYAMEWRSGRFPSLLTCGRRGLLFAAVIVINLALQAARLWSLPVAAISVAGAVAVEVAAERRAS